MEIAAIILSLFFAMNIGASGAAASMGIAYGSGAVPKYRHALIICAVGVLLGAVIGGGEVIKTISSGIIPEHIITIEIVSIIIGSAGLSLFIANVLGIPLSTSEVTVGAVVGVGIAYQVLYIKSIFIILIFWVIVPVIAFCITYFAGRLFNFGKCQRMGKFGKILTVLLIASGFFEAFSAGMNNVANAVGPLVAAGVLTVNQGTLYGGLFVSLGALILGRRVLETNGKKITNLTKGEGILLSSTGAALVIISSIFGMPVPLTQVTSSSIIGMGIAKNGRNVFHKDIVKTMFKVWVVSPILSLTLSYFLVCILLIGDYYTAFIMFSVLLASIGVLSLMKSVKNERRSVHEQGGGI
ncbi:inorganic phosphate transporter [Bacillus gobiensis]|uniref:inorganic phosphate transporter n=1 Tax=Bacillus gobiensis TaxID=1441095 RepID=UPI003D2041E6